MPAKTHGMTSSPEHTCWKAMIARCYNPKNPQFKDYGGRGIAVSAKWRESFAAFLADMGRRPEGTQLDRIDNDLGYAPGNCRWVGRRAQQNNRRNTIFVTYGGETRPLAEWGRILGIPKSTLLNRYFRKPGRPAHEVLSVDYLSPGRPRKKSLKKAAPPAVEDL